VSVRLLSVDRGYWFVLRERKALKAFPCAAGSAKRNCIDGRFEDPVWRWRVQDCGWHRLGEVAIGTSEIGVRKAPLDAAFGHATLEHISNDRLRDPTTSRLPAYSPIHGETNRARLNPSCLGCDTRLPENQRSLGTIPRTCFGSSVTRVVVYCQHATERQCAQDPTTAILVEIRGNVVGLMRVRLPL
jgi:hypothetical protein